MLTLGETLKPGMMKQAVFIISLATMFGTLISYGGSELFNLLAFFRSTSVVLTLALLGEISCLAYTVNNVVISIMPWELRDRVNSGFLAGLMNSATYIGSTASAYGLGRIADGEGENAVILVMLDASVLSAVAGILCACAHYREGTKAS